MADSPESMADTSESTTSVSSPVLVPSTVAPPPVASPLNGSVPQAPTKRVVPPPPPPRSTLPPVRPPDAVGATVTPAQSPLSGVGSARMGRWRDDLPNVKPDSSQTNQLRKTANKRSANEEDGVATDGKFLDREMMPSWLVSTVLHLIFLLILALVATPDGARLTRVLLTMGQSEGKTPVELVEFSIDAAEVTFENEQLEDSPVQVDVESLLTEVNLNAVTPMPVPGASTTSEMSTEEVPVEVGENATAIEIAKPMFGGRTGAMRKALLAIYGGTPETEDAVALGLAWLKSQQKKDGGWSMRGPYDDGGTTENRCAATAMAVLAFMGDGNTHKSGLYAKEVEQGVKFLVKLQDRSGFMADDARQHEQMYAQAQATIALCELYGMTGDSWLRPRAQLAIDFAGDSQSSEGGWRYQPRTDSDMSVTGWFVMALKSGESAKLDIKPGVFYGVDKYLDSIQQYDGAAYPYQRRGAPSPAMTAEGLLCRQYLGWKRNVPAMEIGLESIVGEHPIEMNDQNVYYWYYATQALHHFGGSLWKDWNGSMRIALPNAQVKRGAEKGSWSPQQDSWGSTAGRLYVTCLSLYCLEVYYRHMPLYQPTEE